MHAQNAPLFGSCLLPAPFAAVRAVLRVRPTLAASVVIYALAPTTYLLYQQKSYFQTLYHSTQTSSNTIAAYKKLSKAERPAR